MSAEFSDPFKGKDGKWYFHLKAANGEIVMQSEGYESEEGASKGVFAAAEAAAETMEASEGRDASV